jgi:NADH-quinone oxidoreductase subunit H
MLAMAGWVALATVGTAVGGLLSKWLDRWVTARVQWRVGPPLLQPFYDLAKLFGKETIVPATARRTGFLLAPLLGLSGAVVGVALIWLANLGAAAGHGFVGDLIVILYVLAIPAIATILGGASSSNPHGAVGAAREMKLLISYELPMMICLLAAVVKAGQLAAAAGGDAAWTFRLDEMILAQRAWPVAGSVSGGIALAMALFCCHAKLALVPFDQAEAETELMGGAYVEYSGPLLGTVLLTRALLFAALPLFLISVFFGGLSWGWNLLWSVLQYVLIVVFFVLVRNTNPRVRIAQAVKFFWFGITPIAIVALVLALFGL